MSGNEWFLVFLAMISGVFSPFVNVTNPRQKPEDFQAGMAVVIYGNDQEFEVKTRELLDYLARLEVNSLCLVFPLFQDNWTSSTVWVDEELTPSKERIRLFIRESHKRGFTVMLRPLLNEGSLVPDGKWRGSIQPQDIEAWFSSYGNIVLGMPNSLRRKELKFSTSAQS